MLASKSLMPYDISAQAQRAAQPTQASKLTNTEKQANPSFFQCVAARWLEAKRRESQRIIEDARRFRLHSPGLD